MAERLTCMTREVQPANERKKSEVGWPLKPASRHPISYSFPASTLLQWQSVSLQLALTYNEC
jgi:hypothetical protein